jgi:hypothetical protein
LTPTARRFSRSRPCNTTTTTSHGTLFLGRLLSYDATHTRSQPHNQKKKPQNTIRIPTSQSVRLGLFRGRLVRRVFVLLYRRSLVSSHGRRFFRPQLDTLLVGSSPAITVAVFFCFGLSEIPIAHDRRFYNATLLHMPCFTKQGWMDATDHTITSSQPQRRLPTFACYRCTRNSKSYRCFFFPLFDFERVFLFCSDGSIDHGMVRRISAMKGGTHSRFNGDFCSGLGKKDLFLLRSGFVYSQGLAGCTRASSHFTLLSRDVLRQLQRAVSFCSVFSPGFHRMDIPPFRVMLFYRIID